MRCNFYSIEFGHSTQALSFPSDDNGGKGGNSGYEVHLARHWTDTCLCYFLFPSALSRRKHGRRYKEKEKNALGVALAFMLSSARFRDMCCFTCTYAYVCACVNKAFMLVSMNARITLLKVRASCCTTFALLLTWLVKPIFYLRVFKTYGSSVYVKPSFKLFLPNNITDLSTEGILEVIEVIVLLLIMKISSMYLSQR